MPDVVTGVMAGTSLLSAKAGSDAAGDANDLSARQIQIQEERDRFNRGVVEQGNQYQTQDRDYLLGRRDREERLLDPIQEGIVNRANKGPDYEGAAERSDADVTQAYGLQRDQQRRRRERYGINPASGVSESESRRSGNEEALAKVGGRNKSRLQEDDRDWARKIAAYGTGNMRNAAPRTQLQQLGVSGAAGAYGDASSRSSDQASGAFQLAGNLFADSVDRYDSQSTGLPSSGGEFDYNNSYFEDDYGGG